MDQEDFDDSVAYYIDEGYSVAEAVAKAERRMFEDPGDTDDENGMPF